MDKTKTIMETGEEGYTTVCVIIIKVFVIGVINWNDYMMKRFGHIIG